ncbi:right-handed parallel beta-helix repeat-containing protein [Pedobacter sp. Hv1]|uniref:right-handed parallel beta-helix repeat-containing protein n=1 Tax=Pedobacter sp. Hv1 TaxID=1740090 RepID=UPI0009E8D0F4|nr:right-handed parallel beta-helix repeat-containing protein [Pedobacter sp. Hv1]
MRLKILFICLIALFFAACNKDEDITADMNAKISFSTDSILFDTVFTSIGSTSRRLKIYNRNPKAINISHIKLSGGSTSPFSLNINGQAVTEADLIKLNGNDSINVFVKVSINPTTQNLPFIVQDSILLYYNGNKQSIPLVAYGQNAIFVNGVSIKENTVWDSKLPYLIYKSVSIEENASLTIEPGTKVLFHSNATMSVKGTLIANGTKKDSVLFASDRLEKMYADEPGQWNGIHLYPQSKNSILNYAIIKNGVAGLTVDSLSRNNKPKLLLTNTKIKNMEVVGFLGYQTELTAFNNLFTNCGQYLLYAVGGGKYNLKQNTFAALNTNYPRKTAAVYISDFVSNSQYDNLNIDFQNNIVWGNLLDEFQIDKKAPQTTLLSIVKNNLLKSSQGSLLGNGNMLNVDPLFINPLTGNFNLNKASPALKKGIDLSNDIYFGSYLTKDLNNKTRIFPYDIGCYENK